MLGVMIAVFLFIRFIPGDPVDIMMGKGGAVTEREMEALREQFHLDEPLYQQLLLFLGGVFRGNLGTSFRSGEPIMDMMVETLPATIELALGALLFALIVALPIGVISAVKQNSWLDRLSMAGSFLGISMPAFWLGIVAMLIFAVELDVLPTSGRLGYDVQLDIITGFHTLDALLTGNWAAFKDAVAHLILPSVTLGAAMAAIVARITRSSMLEVLRQDYITTARAKGLAEHIVIIRHALRNALIPTITVVGLQTGVLLGGNMIVETVFSWPGLGRMVVGAIYSRDFPLIQGAVMLYALTFVMANLIVDVLYTYLNPQISL